MDKMREEFERWFFGESGLPMICENTTWQAWQASREALVVELPNAWEDGCELVMNAHRVRMELERAGVAYE